MNRSLGLCLYLVLLHGLVACSSASEPASGAIHTASDTENGYAVVVTGRELLTGVYADGHTHFLTRTLLPLGWHCKVSVCVDDNASEIQTGLRFALEHDVQLVIVTGGLGPTDNDVTREALADFTHIPLDENVQVVAGLVRRFGRPREPLPANLLRQARVPHVGRFLKNANGTSVGLVFECPEYVIVALPGPPRELQPMVRDQLLPYLNRRFGSRLPGSSLTVRFVGLGQSQIDQVLKEHVQLPEEVMLTSQFEGGRVDFTFTLPKESALGRTHLEQLGRQILRYLGDHVYATDDHTTLESRVMERLRAAHQTLAVADAGSGGSFAADLGQANGGEPILIGSYAAPSLGRLRIVLGIEQAVWDEGSPSAHVAILADAVSRTTHSDWSIAIGEPDSRPEGRTMLEVVIRHPGGRIDQVRFPYSDKDPSRFVTRLLDHLRRHLDSA